MATALREALPSLPAAALAAMQDPGKPQRFVDGMKALLSCLQSSKQLLPETELLDTAARKQLADAVNAARQTEPQPPPKVTSTPVHPELASLNNFKCRVGPSPKAVADTVDVSR